MATKGYNSYHGRMSGGKIALIVALALVLVGAVAYLTLQKLCGIRRGGQRQA